MTHIDEERGMTPHDGATPHDEGSARGARPPAGARVGFDPPGSRLPAEPAYWDALAERVVRAARPELGRRPRSAPWWAAFADFSPALAASAILAIVAGWLLVANADPPGGADPVALVEGALGPEDPLARRMLTGAQPPSIADLLVPPPGAEGEG